LSSFLQRHHGGEIRNPTPTRGGELLGVVAESADRGKVAWNYALNRPANHRTIGLSCAAMETLTITTAMTESVRRGRGALVGFYRFTTSPLPA
jgi:hypothetical protein